MHIGLIIYGDLATISGGYLYDRQLVRYLQEQGDEVQIISLPWRNYGRHLLDNFQRDLLQRQRDSTFDMLLQDELNHPSLFLLNRRLRSTITSPLISIVHHLRSSERHSNWQLKLYRQVERSYLQTIDGFVFNSQTTQIAVEALSGRDKPHVVAYPAGSHIKSQIDPDFIQARAQAEGPLHLLFVGNVTPRKGLHILLEALKTIPLKFWQLGVIGDLDGDKRYSDRLIESAVADGLSTNISWHGRLSDEALETQMARSHLLVVPSSYEGFGIVYLEGMRFGLPAIGSTSGAAHETITAGENGFLIPMDDAGALARHITTCHQDRQLLSRMGLAAWQRSQSHPSWETSMRQVREFLLQFV